MSIFPSISNKETSPVLDAVQHIFKSFENLTPAIASSWALNDLRISLPSAVISKILTIPLLKPAAQTLPLFASEKGKCSKHDPFPE